MTEQPKPEQPDPGDVFPDEPNDEVPVEPTEPTAPDPEDE